MLDALHSRRGARARRARLARRTGAPRAVERLADVDVADRRRGDLALQPHRRARPRPLPAGAGRASSAQPGDERAPGGGPLAAEAGERVGAGRRARRPGRAPRARSRRSRRKGVRVCGIATCDADEIARRCSARAPTRRPTRSPCCTTPSSPAARSCRCRAASSSTSRSSCCTGRKATASPSFPHTLVVAEDGAEVTVLDRFGSDPESTRRSPRRRGRRAGRRRQRARPLPLGAGARPAHVAGRAAARAPRPRRVAAGRRRSRSAATTRACAASRCSTGQGAESDLLAVYFGDGDQMLDFRTLQDHDAPNTRSDLLFKGAVEDTAQSVYSGLIRIRRDAQKSKAFQTNRNLVLTEGAEREVDPEPRDRGQRRAVLARQHRRPDRRRPALLPREPRRPARGGRAADRARASSTTCSTACRCRRWSRRCGAAWSRSSSTATRSREPVAEFRVCAVDDVEPGTRLAVRRRRPPALRRCNIERRRST